MVKAQLYAGVLSNETVTNSSNIRVQMANRNSAIRGALEIADELTDIIMSDKRITENTLTNADG